MDIPALAQRFRDHDCHGIAAYLEFLVPLKEEDRTVLFKITLVNCAGMDSTIDDPFEFFATMLTVQERKRPFKDAGVVLLEYACNSVSGWWIDSGV